MIIDFLKTKTSKENLKIALEVINEFKECESQEEWMMISFTAWAKLEQLEEFLNHIVNNDDLRPDTKRQLEIHFGKDSI